MIKRHLEAKVLRIRGGHAMNKVLASLKDMDEATAHQWYTLLQNLEADSHSSGAHEASRQPWKFSR